MINFDDNLRVKITHQQHFPSGPNQDYRNVLQKQFNETFKLQKTFLHFLLMFLYKHSLIIKERSRERGRGQLQRDSIQTMS
jgi:hypothetical protein